MNEDFLFLIYSIISEIPEGKVATYGQIAELSGYDRNSRQVGKALRIASIYGDYPCHRVVNHQGRLCPGWLEQKSLLLNEGVKFNKNGNVDLKNHKWDIL